MELTNNDKSKGASDNRRILSNPVRVGWYLVDDDGPREERKGAVEDRHGGFR
jgi:hypothetical protein